MDAARAAAAASPHLSALGWTREEDGLTDMRLTCAGESFFVHAAIVAAGARRSDVLFEQRQASKGSSFDLSDLVPELFDGELTDADLTSAFETLLDWIYSGRELELPSFAARKAAKGLTTPTKSPSRAVTSDQPSAFEYLSTALFGTPAPTPTKPSSTPAAAAPAAADGAETNGAATKAAPGIKVSLAKFPVLWQLAGSLRVHGLKGALLPLLEEGSPSGGHASRFVMDRPAFSRLRLLMSAVAINAKELTAALCEQLAVPLEVDGVPIDARSTQRLAPLGLAAAACDASRYDAVAEMGLMPPSLEDLLVLLDSSALRVPSEAPVMAFILKHIAAAGLSDADASQLWATCRFAHLPPASLIELAEVPNVPARMLALACAQTKAKAAGSSVEGSSAELVRLQPRDFYQ